ADLGRLLRHRNVRENTNPDAASTLHVTGDRPACGLNLTCRHPLRLERLQAKRAEIQRRAAFGLTVNAALVRLAKLRALWLQHDLRPRTSSGARARALGLAPATATAFLHIKGAPLRGHRIVLHDLALVEDRKS